MGRARTIHVDADALLRAIVNCYDSDHAAITAELSETTARWEASRDWHAWQVVGDLQRSLEDLEADGMLYQLSRFAGRHLSDSERIRHQQVIRALEAEGLVQLRGRRATHVLPTQAARDRIGNG